MCWRDVSKGCLESRDVVRGQRDRGPEVYCGVLCAYYILYYISAVIILYLFM
jgi:hypothetical protein